MLRFAFLCVFLFCVSVQAAEIQAKKIVDLTHSFNRQTIYWPTAESFQFEKVAWGKTEAGYFYSSANIAASEHGGTHLDAPIHFAEKGWTSDQIPIDRFVGAALVIDISTKCAENPDYTLTPADVQEWEKRNGKIPSDSIVLVHTGWGKFWPDKKKYLGDDKPGDVSNLHFPAYSKEAADFLVKERKIKGVGIDTASLDPGTSKDFIAHQIFNGANVYGLENVANLDQLPPAGAFLIALPMKIENGTGGPVRIIALVD